MEPTGTEVIALCESSGKNSS